MTKEEIRNILIEFIGSNDYRLLSETIKTDYDESFIIKGHTYPVSSRVTLKIEINLSKDFTEKEQQEIMKESDLEFDDIYYLIEYKNKIKEEVA